MSDEQQLLLLLLLLALEGSIVSAQVDIPIGATRCFDCQIGSYSAADGAEQCSFCSAGYYASSMSSTGCQECPAGMIFLYFYYWFWADHFAVETTHGTLREVVPYNNFFCRYLQCTGSVQLHTMPCWQMVWQASCHEHCNLHELSCWIVQECDGWHICWKL